MYALKNVISFDLGRRREPDLLTSTVKLLPARETARTALLATTDKSSLRWAPRWLGHAGFEVELVSTPEAALAFTAERNPELILVDAGFQDDTHCLLVNSLRDDVDTDTPVFALCQTDTDIELAMTSSASDVIRRPFNWEVITHRAVKAVKARELAERYQEAERQIEEFKDANSAAERRRALSEGTDTLTGLPTGERFRKLSHKAISARANLGKRSAMLAIRVDRYRMVNEAVGHSNGNLLLKQFADRLRQCIARRDVIGSDDDGTVMAILGRLNGARFAVQVANGDIEQIERFHRALSEELKRPFEVDGQSIYLTVSAGAAVYPDHCDNADELKVFAESALLDAKQLGRGLHVYSPFNRVSGMQMLKLDTMLRSALKNDELDVHFQPITNTATGEISAAEALLRWTHPTEGDISPGRFVPVAEKTGLMREIGEFVIDRACAELRNWIDDGMDPIRIAVNLSLCQILRGDIVTTTKAALERYGIDPELLEFELSERGVLNQHPEVIDEIRRLKDVGVRISIDDFGTGQAAIGYLKNLPIDVIKIDRSYVSGPERSARDTAIASGIVALAERLDATVIAEGVETEEQLDLLKTWGSHEAQGFLFSKALPSKEFFKRYG